MRTNFNFFFEPPQDMVFAPKSLPIYPTRIDPQEKLKIEVTPKIKNTDWLKWTVCFLGLTTAIVGTMLASQVYYQNKAQEAESAKAKLEMISSPVQVQEPQAIQKTVVDAPPASVPAESNAISASAAVSVTNQDSTIAEVNTGEPVKAETPSEPPKQAQKQPIVEKQQLKPITQNKPAVAHTSNAPAPVQSNQSQAKTPPVLQAAASTPKNAESTVTVPKFIIANDSNQQQSNQQKQSGIFKRPVQAEKPKAETSAAGTKQDSSTQKLF